MNTARILDGKWLSKIIQTEIAARVSMERADRGRAPGLGVILVGDNPASHTYVANKTKLARVCGFECFDRTLPSEATAGEVAEAIESYNRDSRVDGILLQLPLPKSLAGEQNRLLDLIAAQKDADGLGPLSQGLLMRGEGKLRPCTPSGIMKLIDLAYSDVEIGDAGTSAGAIPASDLSGKSAVVIGRSILVGKPVSLMLLERNATVTMVHSKTKDLSQLVKQADVVVAALGKPDFVRGAWIKEGAVVIDVGINRLPTGKLRGDVCYEEALSHCAAITPVPGGVGPMTVTMLIYNTLQSYLASRA